MSKNFKIPESRKIKNPQAAYQLDEDALEGLRSAAFNGQPGLAARYNVYVLDILDDWMTEVNNRLTAMESAKPAPKAKAVEAAAE